MEWKNAVFGDDNTLKVPKRWIFPQYYEAFNLLFRIENALRVFVYVILKNQHQDGWADIQVTEDGQSGGTISSIAKKRLGQSKTFGYLGFSIVCPIMHLTSGEMTRLITSDAYWSLFKDHFLGSREIIRNKLEEIGSIRNAIAHFRPIKKDDVDAIKHNSKHVLLGVERFLDQALIQSDVIPTNTTHKWYTELKTLGTDHCKFIFYQSKDENWVRLHLEYACPILQHEARWRGYIHYMVLTLNSSAILIQFKELRKAITYLSEQVPYAGMKDNFKPEFRKSVTMVFSKKNLETMHEGVKKDIQHLLLCISKETELIEQDNLAKGDIVHAVSTSASAQEKDDTVSWTVYTNVLQTPPVDSDPPEYWGDLSFYGWEDFIAGTDRYPWMPAAVSEAELPF